MELKQARKAIPIKRQVKQIVLLLLATVLVLLTLGYFQVQAMSAVRAYVRGEGLYAKAQKDAVMYLREYLHQPSENLYQAFIRTLNVNHSDQQARYALQKQPVDRVAAREGFLGGGNHPDDVGSMIWFFQWFQNISHMKNAIDIWTQADMKLEELRQLSYRIRNTHQQFPDSDLFEFESELKSLDNQLNELELRFSSELSQGARWMENTFMLVNLGLLAALIMVIGAIARKIIAEIDQTETQLRVSESRFRALYQSNILGILVWKGNGELADANDEFLNILGYSRKELEAGQLNWRDLTPEENQASDDKAMAEIAERGYCTPFNKEFFHKLGHRVPVFVGGALMDGEADTGVAFMVDRSNEKTKNDQLMLSSTVLEASRDGILICDTHRRVLTANDAFYQMTGLSRGAVLQQPACLGGAEDSVKNAEINSQLDSQGYWQGDSELPLSHGSTLPVRASISTVHDDTGEITHYVAVYTDISARKALEEDLKTLAHYDHLTGLANRSLYADRLETAIARAQRHQQQCALLFIDLDKFKPVNDQYGHEVGDELLMLVAKRLLALSRKSDTVGRLGGDEFVMIVEALFDTDSVLHIAEKIVAQLHQPFDIGGNRISIGCSIGIAIYPNHGINGNELTRAADIAMYRAKAQQHVRFSVYRPPEN